MSRRITKPDSEAITSDIVAAVLDGELRCADFALGFAAAVDMLVGGTMDLANPVGMVVAARRDVVDVTDRRRIVTDIMEKGCAAARGAE